MKHTVTIFLVVALMMIPALMFAGDHKEGKELQKVVNEAYKKNCGTCHFAYQPGLLPARSWGKILDEPGGHPGGMLTIEKNAKREIKNYLVDNSAEKSSGKRSRKILASIGNSTPTKISETPYIKEKHRKIKQEIFMQKSIGSRGNCSACHKSAEKGIYDDDDVVIPKP
jgi:hypothetical protein